LDRRLALSPPSVSATFRLAQLTMAKKREVIRVILLASHGLCPKECGSHAPPLAEVGKHRRGAGLLDGRGQQRQDAAQAVLPGEKAEAVEAQSR
jgi:hypothetical protein